MYDRKIRNVYASTLSYTSPTKAIERQNESQDQKPKSFTLVFKLSARNQQNSAHS